jgi:Spy/CpxP family protein refolding chaperone
MKNLELYQLLEKRFERLENILRRIYIQGQLSWRKENEQMATLDELVEAAQAEDTKIDSLVALTERLHQKVLDALSGTLTPEQQAKIDEAFAAIADNPDRIQAAIDANTVE